jgi:hypothetical protein
MEKLCDMLGRHLLFSSRFAEAAGDCDGRLESLGQFKLRGVGEPREIFGLRLPRIEASVRPGLIAQGGLESRKPVEAKAAQGCG